MNSRINCRLFCVNCVVAMPIAANLLLPKGVPRHNHSSTLQGNLLAVDGHLCLVTLQGEEWRGGCTERCCSDEHGRSARGTTGKLKRLAGHHYGVSFPREPCHRLHSATRMPMKSVSLRLAPLALCEVQPSRFIWFGEEAMTMTIS
uniref:Secreted protein n=1 Tax=Arundo donax TaxID=35708 RepID=A0A0A9ET48_ARUDO